MNYFKHVIYLILIVLACSSCSQFTSPRFIEPPYGWSTGNVEANGIRLRYYRTGGNLPPLVLSHGFTDNGLFWTGLAHALEKQYDVIMYDIRGHGFSDAPETGYAMEDLVADMVGLIRALELEHPVIMGHSLGGSICAALAAEYPNLPQKVVLVDPPGLVIPMFRGEIEKKQMRNSYQGDIYYLRGMSRGRLLKEAARRHPNFSNEDHILWANSKKQMKPQIANIITEIPFLQPDLSKIKAPTLILKADADEILRKIELDTVSALPSVSVVHIDGSGHNIPQERLDAMLKVLQDFLGDN